MCHPVQPVQFMEGRQERETTNRRSRTRFGLGWAMRREGDPLARPLASPFPSRSERTYSSSRALIFPRVGYGWRERNPFMSSVRSVGQVEFPSKRQFSFYISPFIHKEPQQGGMYILRLLDFRDFDSLLQLVSTKSTPPFLRS